MTDGTTTTTTTTAPPAWHNGVDATILGHWQNKNYDLSDPAKVAIAATQAAIEAQRFVGAPPDQLVRLPKDTNDAAGWDAVHQRLGTPREAKDYDFAGIKFGDGTELEAGFTDAMRGALHKARVSKDAAPEVVKAVIKYLDDADATDGIAKANTLTDQKKALKDSWGTRHDENLLAAKQAARRLGVDPETVAALENVVGYDKVMEMFRKIGAGTNEDTFVEGRGPGAPATQQSAQARMEELKADEAWRKRLFAGDAAAKREFHALMEQISGVAA
jgi:hypothetical protein